MRKFRPVTALLAPRRYCVFIPALITIILLQSLPWKELISYRTRRLRATRTASGLRYGGISTRSSRRAIMKRASFFALASRLSSYKIRNRVGNRV